MAFAEPLDAFFADFGVTGTLAGGAAVTGIFDRDYMASLGGQVSATGPAFGVKTSDVAARGIAFGTAITIGGTAYTVRDTQPDGTGVTLLLLET